MNKILFVIGSLHIGGAESQMLLLASELVKRGREVHLFSLEEEGPLKASLDKAGVRVHTGGYDSRAPRWQKILLLLRAQWQLLGIVRSERPQVLHAYLPLTNLMGAVAGRLVGTRMIVTSRRALGTHQDRHRWWPWFDRLANHCSTVITANSQAVVEDTLRRDKVSPSKLRLIYNGLNFPDLGTDPSVRREVRGELALTEGVVAIVFVANLIPYKGHHELIEAFAALHGRRPGLRLFLVGEDRGIGSSLRQLATDLGVGDVTVMLGRRQDVPRFLQGMDMGVMASHEEGCSNALLEKLAAGLPVVATDVGGNPEVLADMPGCALVPPRDAKRMAGAIEDVLGTSFGSPGAARQRVSLVTQRFSVRSMVDAHESLYRDVSPLPTLGGTVPGVR